MTPAEQTTALREALDKVIDRFRAEFDLTYATVVGVLTIMASDLCEEGREE